MSRQLDKLLEARVQFLRQADITNIFGAALATTPVLDTNWFAQVSRGAPRYAGHFPEDWVLPAGPSGVTLSGQRSLDRTQNKDHEDIYAIGQAGYLVVFYRADGESVEAAMILDRVDKTFVPLHSESEITNRMAWEQTKLAAIQQWIMQHPPKGKNLGAVEVTPGNPTRLDLDSGKACFISTVTPPGTSGELQTGHYSWRIDQEDLGPGGSRHEQFVRQLGQEVWFARDGEIYHLTPKIKE